MTDQNLAKLREILLNEFTEAELVSLCKDIGLNYEMLPGAGTFGKTREIVEAARTQDKLRALQTRIRELRPDAYDSASIAPSVVAVAPSAATTATSRATTVSPQSPHSQASSGKGIPIQWIAVALGVLLCVVIALTLLLPRAGGLIGAQPGAQPNGQPANQPVSTAVAPSANITPEAAVATAMSAPTVQEPVDSKGVDGLELTPAAPAGSDSANATAQALATSIAVENATAAVTNATTNAGVTGNADSATPVAKGGGATPESEPASPAQSATLGPNEITEPAQAVRGLNDQLPGFYDGTVPTSNLQQFWRGSALRQVTVFGNARLPRILRLGSDSRSVIDTNYEYLRPPTVVKEDGSNATVTAREYWRYNNQAKGISACETRDYTYYLIKDGDNFKVNQFTGKLLSSSCNPS
jgi:hypothetical protein